VFGSDNNMSDFEQKLDEAFQPGQQVALPPARQIGPSRDLPGPVIEKLSTSIKRAFGSQKDFEVRLKGSEVAIFPLVNGQRSGNYKTVSILQNPNDTFELRSTDMNLGGKYDLNALEQALIKEIIPLLMKKART